MSSSGSLACFCSADLDAILTACEDADVQFMDSTMMMHKSWTNRMREVVADKDTISDIRMVSLLISLF